MLCIPTGYYKSSYSLVQDDLIMSDFEPKIVGFFCNWCSYSGPDLSSTPQMKYPPNVRVIRVMCSGRIGARLILQVFTAGADGVLICGCHPEDCHYQQGNLNARRRITGLSPFLDAVGIGKDRLRLEWLRVSEEPEITETIRSFTQAIKECGPNPMVKG